MPTSNGTAGWKTKDLVTWALLLYALYKVGVVEAAAPPSPADCRYGPMVTTLQAPLWVRGVTQTFTMEGEQ